MRNYASGMNSLGCINEKCQNCTLHPFLTQIPTFRKWKTIWFWDKQFECIDSIHQILLWNLLSSLVGPPIRKAPFGSAGSEKVQIWFSEQTDWFSILWEILIAKPRTVRLHWTQWRHTMMTKTNDDQDQWCPRPMMNRQLMKDDSQHQDQKWF